MPRTSLTVGDIEITALLDGARRLSGAISDYFPDVPGDALTSFEAEAPGVYDEGGWRLHVRAWLIRHGSGVVLVDTGVGELGAPGPTWFGAPGDLAAELRRAGTAPDGIDTVVLTHVHDDHLGGTVAFAGGVPEPAFPRATYLLQRADRAWQRQLALEDDEDRVIEVTLLQPLEHSGQLQLLDGDHTVADGVELQPAPGHTPGHQIVRVRSRGSLALITGDAFNHPIQIPHPAWPSGTDSDPAEASRTRRSILAELAARPGTPIAPSHLAEPFGEVRSTADGPPMWRSR